jgi:hypothetical protein
MDEQVRQNIHSPVCAFQPAAMDVLISSYLSVQGLIYWLNTLGETVPSALLVSSWTDLADGQVITELTQYLIVSKRTFF